MSIETKLSAEEFAAQRRADYARALNEERVALVTKGLDDRVKQVDAELKRVNARVEPPTETAAPSVPAAVNVNDAKTAAAARELVSGPAATPAPAKAAARRPAKPKAAARRPAKPKA